MKMWRFAVSMASLTIASVAFAALPGVPTSNAGVYQREVKTLAITTTLKGAGDVEAGDLVTTLKAGQISGVSLKKGRRFRSFALIDRTQLSNVACEAKDAEYGEVRTKAGSWIAVVMCPQSSSPMPIRVPELVRARASANDAPATMDCWENKELRMGVCFKLGTQPVTQTREHILLARQVGVP